MRFQCAQTMQASSTMFQPCVWPNSQVFPCKHALVMSSAICKVQQLSLALPSNNQQATWRQRHTPHDNEQARNLAHGQVDVAKHEPGLGLILVGCQCRRVAQDPACLRYLTAFDHPPASARCSHRFASISRVNAHALACNFASDGSKSFSSGSGDR